MSTFALPDEALQAPDPLKGENNSIQLPFAAPELWWFNGKPELADTEEIKDPRRFGGWGISADKLVEMAPQLPPIPAAWKLFENLHNGEGKLYSAYLCRAVRVTPILRRWRWVTSEKFNGSQVNFLCLLAVADENKNILPWGPVVVTGKRYSGKAIEDAFKKFGDDTRDLRGDTPARWFYAPIGTFGPKPVFENKQGKSGKSSSITPCQLGRPANGWDTPTLESLFVGKDIALQCLEMAKKADAWAKDWDKPSVKTEDAPPMPEEPPDDVSAF